MTVDVKYTTKARATGGRDGQSGTLDNAIQLRMSTPKELGGDGGPGVNPEQLFACGYAACFLGAMKFVSAHEDGYCEVTDDTSVTSSVGIGPRSEGGFGLEIALCVELPNIETAEATRLINRAHEVCPYSNATRNNIDVKVELA